MLWITENWMQLLLIANTLMLAASYIAKLTPTKKDDKIIKKIITFLSVLPTKKK
jgi:hypothetical protein